MIDSKTKIALITNQLGETICQIETPEFFQMMNEDFDSGRAPDINLKLPLKELKIEAINVTPEKVKYAVVGYNFYGEKMVQYWVEYINFHFVVAS